MGILTNGLQYFLQILTAYTGSDEIAYVGYVESCDDPINKTMVLAIARSKLEMTGNIIASGN